MHQLQTATSDAHSQRLPSVYTTTTVTTDDNLDITGLVYPQFSALSWSLFRRGSFSLPPFEEFGALVYDQIHQEQVVAGMATQGRVENPSVEEQVIVQEIPQVPIVKQIPEQIVDITGLVNPQFSITAVEAFSPQVVRSLPPLEEFDAPVYLQIHQEQIVAGETTQNMVENPAVQEPFRKFLKFPL